MINFIAGFFVGIIFTGIVTIVAIIICALK
jgi:hypothetical protein